MNERLDGRKPDQLRPVRIQRRYLPHAEGSALIRMGGTRVLCAATVEESVPPFLRGQRQGWITAEYSMLPRATQERTNRRPGGRSMEIQRLIGRSLRAVADLEQLGSRTIILDCDVIQADGGTRSAAVTGAFVALYDAVRWLQKRHLCGQKVILDFLAAVSVGQISGQPFVDLCYQEDQAAGVDMNVVMTGAGRFVEVQGTAEEDPFSQRQMDEMLSLARQGILSLVAIQKKSLKVGSI
jgi:ribonuclease PH